MKRFFRLNVVLSLIVISCSQSSDTSSIAPLKNKKYSIDSLINKDRNLIAMARVQGSESLVPVPQAAGKKVEGIYNFYKDGQGRIIYISEMPKSPDDEWFISYKSYFNENGKLFAFQRQNNFFNSGCTKGAALESLTKYYNANFEVADSVYTLTDSYKKELKKADCKFPYNFPYTINKSVKEYQQRVKGL